jgi:hypothetical protein
MNKRFLLICLGSFALLAFEACKKEEVIVSDVPEVSVVSVSPGTVKELTDSLVFVLHYKDGDGDLGENNPDALNLFVQDNRIGETEAFRIPQLAPTGADISIEGDLQVVLPNTGITDGSSSQTATFTLWVRDRAGHESNKVASPAVTVVK